MDFNWKKPSHLLALLLLLVSILFLFISSILTYFQPFPSTSELNQYTGLLRLYLEIFTVFFSLLIVFCLMVFIPMVWYYLVNHFRLRDMLERLNLRKEGLSQTFLWGTITAVAALIITVLVDMLLLQLGYDTTQMSNITALESLFSFPTLVALVTIQPIAEEFFFRGFLLDKISSVAGVKVGVLSTAVLFGIAHLSYGMLYTSVMAGILDYYLLSS